MANFCSKCGAALNGTGFKCPNCGADLGAPINSSANSNINPAWPVRSKIAAGLFGILLGNWGIHKFYLGKTGLGVLYIVFCWTGIPGLIGLIEGIIYLCSDDVSFQIKNQVRIQ